MYCGRPKTIDTAKLFVTFLAIFLLLSCGSKKNASASANTSIKQPPQIIFLNYAIAQETNGSKAIKLISTKKAEGKIKQKNSNEKASSGDLICYQLDKKSSVISKMAVKNPLHKHIEYLDESKSFKAAQIKSDNAHFSIRLQLNPDTKYISIRESNASNYLIKSKVNTL